MHPAVGVSVLDFNHDGWMDIAFTHSDSPSLTLSENNQGKRFVVGGHAVDVHSGQIEQRQVVAQTAGVIEKI